MGLAKGRIGVLNAQVRRRAGTVGRPFFDVVYTSAKSPPPKSW